ncbi:MAG: C25 family cysteine peptidase [bacterium]|nr:C25 family cysteine peptidase [bacterium]
MRRIRGILSLILLAAAFGPVRPCVSASAGPAAWSAFPSGKDAVRVTARFSAPFVQEEPGRPGVALRRSVTFFVLCDESAPEVTEESRSASSDPGPEPLVWADDIALTGEDGTDRVYSAGENKPSVVVTDMGRDNGRRVFSIRLDPDSEPRGAGSGKWTEAMTVLITAPNILVSEHPPLGSGWKKPAAKAAPLSKNAVPPGPLPFKPPCVQIRYTEEGFYHVPRSLVVNAGWDVSDIDPRRLSIVGPEGEIPIRVIGEEDGSFDFPDAVEFFGKRQWNTEKPGEKRLNPYTTDNVVWLVLKDGPGIRYAEQNVAVPAMDGSVSFPRSFPWTEHIEQDWVFNRLGNSIADTLDDPEYWVMTYAPRGGQSRTLSFTIQQPDPYAAQTASMRLKFQGQTSGSEIQPVDFLINEKLMVSDAWSDNTPVLVHGEDFSPSHLIDGRNTLTAVNRSSEGERSIVSIDWFELTYPRLYRTEGRSIRFKPPLLSAGSLCPFRIEGFETPDIELYKSEAGKLTGFRTLLTTDSLGQDGYTIFFQDRIVDESVEYFAVTRAGKLAPDTVTYMPSASLRVQGRGADILVVTPSDTLGRAAMGEWIALRESQGYRVVFANLDSIYAEFNYGIPSPSAIRDFFRFAKAHWNPAPRFALLVGDGALNYRPVEIRRHLIPSPLFHTMKLGGTASDHWYTLLDGDDESDIAIGRLPVRSQTELMDVVSKIVEYEQAPVSAWRNRYLMINGGSTTDVFTTQIQSLVQESVPRSLSPNRLYRHGPASNPEVGGRTRLLGFMNEGIAWINYRGHGGGGIWADGTPSVMSLDDVDSLKNAGKYPIVTSLTCFTGDFTSARDCLGEAMLRKPDAGAIAFLGTTSLGWTNADFVLMQNMLTVFRGQPNLTIGEIIQKGKTLYRMQNNTDLAESEVHQYNLIGDPCLRFAFPPESDDFTLSERSIGSGDSVRFEWKRTNGPLRAFIEVIDSTIRTRSGVETGLPAGPVTRAVPLPAELRSGPSGLRIHALDEGSGFQSRSFKPFAVESSHFDSVWTYPAEPLWTDSVAIHCRLTDRLPILRVLCEISQPSADSVALAWSEHDQAFTGIRRIGPFRPGSALLFRIRAETENGVTTGAWQSRVIPTQADAFVSGIDLSGESYVSVRAKIQNGGQTGLAGLAVRFECAETGWSGADTVDVPAGSTVTASAPWESAIGTYTFSVLLDPDRTMAESRTDNNRSSKRLTVKTFRVTPEAGSMNGTAGPSPVGFESMGAVRSIRCLVQPGTVPAPDVLTVRSDLNWARGQSREEEPALLVHLISFAGMGEDAALPIPLRLTFVLVDSLSQAGYRPYRQDRAIGEWIAVPYSRSDSVIAFDSFLPGLFCFMPATDTEPPRVEIEMEDQFFSDGGFVPARPRFSILIEDPSGVDSRPGAAEIVLDETRRTDYAWLPSDSGTGNLSRRIRFEPELSAGEHTLRVSASDLHGNTVRSAAVRFSVADRFDLAFLGNHPNPFRRETVFAYRLASRADRVTLKIYTVSGKLIRVFEDASMAAPDYHEIVWDGSDDWGDPVANGVYFFRMTGLQGSLRREITGKIARTR